MQVALAGAADGRVAGHIAHRVQIDGKQNRPQTQSGSGQRSLNPRVARADHCHITVSRVISGHWTASPDFFFSSGGNTKGLHTTSHRLMGVPS